MSMSQTIILSQHDFEIFAPSWQAGIKSSQCLTRSLRNYNIEGVNVAETCEKLSLALKENSNCQYGKEHHVANKQQCAVSKSNIPFRVFSNIWFGTLKIYQQQVNTLFRLSQDLFSTTCNCNVQHLKGSKRKSSTSHKFLKKRRLTLSECNVKTYLTTNYSELLEDLEKLTKEPMQKSLQEFSDTVTQFQIREITIREISSMPYTPLDMIDEDSEFGEATNEEIAQFLNFAEENSMFNNKRTSIKRKSTCEQECPIKMSCYSNDSLFDLLSDENSPLNKNVLKTEYLKRSITPTNITDNSFNENEIMKQIDKIVGAKKKKNNLIIDECTKIDMSEIMDQIQTSKLLAKVSRKKILKSYKSKRNIKAIELLTKFNRRSLKLSLSFKQKFYISREQFQQEYINLLREIFKINYKEQLASEIYPKWKYLIDGLRKHNKTQNLNKPRKEKQFALLQSDTDTNDLNEVLNTNDIENQEIPTRNIDNTKMLYTCIYYKWCPYGVMAKLLSLWRFNQTNKIAAAKLFKLAENQINRALGFNSLLNLSKKQFVTLTKFPKSIQLQNVLIGKAINNNITNKLSIY